LTRVDFYILPDVDLEARRRFACRLHKAVTDNACTCMSPISSEPRSRRVDVGIPDHRFLPHGINGEPASVSAPGVIDHREPDSGADQLLINLATTIPTFFGRFERVAEIVVQSSREDGRDRYKYYRDRGYPLFHHEIDPSEDR
jgi:DNA polymerase-3 subunit chi